jgi:NTE family protein
MRDLLRWFRSPGSSKAVFGGIDLGAEPWLVLGGGGLRGLAHLGAWRALRDVGFRPYGILGTSIGALVGACLAGERALDELEALALQLTRDDVARMPKRVLWAQGIRSPSLYEGDFLMRYIERVVPAGGWDSLGIPFQLNAVELGSGRMEWFGPGARTDVPLAEAVYASAALPVFYPPRTLPGGVYVDGGTMDALPIERAADLGATGIVAIDVGSAESGDADRAVERGMLAIHERVFGLMSGDRRRTVVREWSGPPLLYVRPPLEHRGTLDFDNLEELIAEGRRATESALGAPASQVT